MGLIKDRIGMDLTEAEDIKKSWQEYTEELYKKDLHDPDNHNGMITHSPRTTHPGMRSQGDLRKHRYEQSSWRWWNSSWTTSNPKRWSCEVLHSICQQIWKTQQWPQDWKRSVFIPIPKKGNTKECSNYHTIALISHASKVMLKILRARLQQYVNCELPDVQAGFRRGRGIRDQIVNIHWIIEKARKFQKKTSISALLAVPKTLTVWITENCGKFLKKWGYQTTISASWEVCMQVRKQQLELDMEQHTGSKSGKEYVKAVYCHPAYLGYMQSTSWEMLGWRKHKLESRLLGEIQ